jgi:hypothetical protein
MTAFATVVIFFVEPDDAIACPVPLQLNATVAHDDAYSSQYE